MSDELPTLIAETRRLLATMRKLQADNAQQAQRWIEKNTALCTQSQNAIARSIALLTKRRAS